MYSKLLLSQRGVFSIYMEFNQMLGLGLGLGAAGLLGFGAN
jgi:hypothetical protein